MWIEKIYIVPSQVVAVMDCPDGHGGTRIWLTGGFTIDTNLDKREIVQMYSEHVL